MDSDVEINSQNKKQMWNLSWLPALIIKPRAILHTINEQQKNVWLTPLLVISALAILMVLVAAPIRRNTIQMGLTTPPDFQYYSPEQQAQFLNAQATQTSPLFLYVFPVIFGLVSIWLSWFLLSSILHLVLTLTGSHASSLKAYNLVGWAMLPLGVRSLVQIIGMLIMRSTINGAGLSGLLGSDVSGVAAYLAAFLGLVDIFFLWVCLLLVLGVRDFSGLSKSKAVLATVGTIFIFMLIFALPGFLKSILSNLSIGQYYFF
jgi:hypothetical protein